MLLTVVYHDIKILWTYIGFFICVGLPHFLTPNCSHCSRTLVKILFCQTESLSLFFFKIFIYFTSFLSCLMFPENIHSSPTGMTYSSYLFSFQGLYRKSVRLLYPSNRTSQWTDEASTRSYKDIKAQRMSYKQAWLTPNVKLTTLPLSRIKTAPWVSAPDCRRSWYCELQHAHLCQH